MSVKKIARRAAKRAAAKAARKQQERDESRVERRLRRRTEAIERQIIATYGEASANLAKLADQFRKSFEDNERMMQVRLRWGQITQSQYDAFMMDTIIRSEEYERLARAAAATVNHAGEAAADFINDRLPWFFAQEANYTTYLVEGISGRSSFALIDEQTIRYLSMRYPRLLPEVTHNTTKTTQHVERRLRQELISGILQGESVDKLADRFQTVTRLPRAASVRNARTAITGARNGGVQESLERAQEAGILVQKQWQATLDYRTRDTHAWLDGERIDVDEYYSNGLLFPGDAHGRPSEVYNCRCKSRPIVDGIDPMRRRDNTTGDIIDYVPYTTWKRNKEKQAKERANASQ